MTCSLILAKIGILKNASKTNHWQIFEIAIRSRGGSFWRFWFFTVEPCTLFNPEVRVVYPE
jgi:hypothetical protein